MNPKLERQLRAAGIPPSLWDRITVDGRPVGEAGERVQVEKCSDGTMRIVVPGTPIGKPRQTRRDKWKKRPCVVRYRQWCDRVRATLGNPPEAARVLAVNWTAYFEPPVSWPKKKRLAAIGTLHRERPDKDNVEKAIFDCLWPECDSAIADGRGTKRWDWTARLEIEITQRQVGCVG